ncbi:MAG: type II toxin-antitoxin system VapC family toxin [Candidatus Riflebacteria bacterium]|nr:type II toxin-antitoxin system VapC family toxin [Candidatus Riflebacteria bacterium]
MTVFVDTSAFLALLDGDDVNHPAAVACFRDLRTEGSRLRTTNYVLVETTALIQARLGIAALRAFRESYQPLLDVTWMGETDHERAFAAILVVGRRRLSLVDCASFDCMRGLGLLRAFTFDRHFTEQGFERIPYSR